MTRKYDSEFAFKYHRKSTRQPNHNYAWTSTYFITICAANMEPLFDDPTLRTILEETWQALPARFPNITLDEFIIMPNHIHLIIHIEGNTAKPIPLGRIIGAYKSITTLSWLRHIENARLEQTCIIWHRNYYDIAIYKPGELEETRTYIRNNPIKALERQQQRAKNPGQ